MLAAYIPCLLSAGGGGEPRANSRRATGVPPQHKINYQQEQAALNPPERQHTQGPPPASPPSPRGQSRHSCDRALHVCKSRRGKGKKMKTAQRLARKKRPNHHSDGGGGQERNKARRSENGSKRTFPLPPRGQPLPPPSITESCYSDALASPNRV